MPKDRGAEQVDVDGPLECSPALGMVAAETRGRVAAQQASGSLLWIGVDHPSELQRLQADHAVRLQRNCQLPVRWSLNNSPEPTTRGTRLQKNGGLPDLWSHG